MKCLFIYKKDMTYIILLLFKPLGDTPPLNTIYQKPVPLWFISCPAYRSIGEYNVNLRESGDRSLARRARWNQQILMEIDGHHERLTDQLGSNASGPIRVQAYHNPALVV